MNVEASKREDSSSIELQREFTRDEVKDCVAKLKNRKAAGADGIVNEFLEYGGEGMITMMVLLYNWIWRNVYTPKRWKRRSTSHPFQKRRQDRPREL